MVTIQDLIYRIFPEAHSPIRSRAMSFLIPLSARRAHRIITPSESTRSDLLRLLHVSPDKIDVIPLGLGAHRVTPSAEAGLRSRLALDGRRVALTASAKRPHKNLMRLLDAWALLPNEARPVLVLPGYPTPHETQLREHAARLNLESDTRFLGWVPPPDLEGLYALASCFVFPSLYEGFGLPVLEAMARGVPVACSNRGSLAEVAGQAALLFDPENPRAIADAVQSILGNPATASSLRIAGQEQAQRFTWSATAQATLRSYERALESSE